MTTDRSRIAVLGGGAGRLAMAADLGLKGLTVDQLHGLVEGDADSETADAGRRAGEALA